MGTVLIVAIGLLLGAGAMAPVHAGAIFTLLLEKLVNGDTADAAPGPLLLVGSLVTFTYEVSVSGLSPDSGIVNVLVTDDNATAGLGDDFNPAFTGGDTIANGRLDDGEIWTFSATRPALLGDHENIATLNASFIFLPDPGTPLPLTPVQDSGHYRGIAPVGVPEPTTLALLGAGLVVLGSFRRVRS